MSVSRNRGGSRGTAVLGAVAVVAAAALATGVASSDASAAGATSTYLVVYKESSSTSGAGNAVTAAGGQVVATYAPISVVVARSSNPDFAVRMRTVKGVDGAVAMTRFASAVDGGAVADNAVDATSTTDSAPAPGSAGLNDPLSGLQWDMTQINAGAAHAISTGSRSVLVGDIDTGLDYTHPDLAPNVDANASANCVSGAPVPGLVAANDDNGHGTHTAGTIAAAANGIGIVGVAPNVRIAGIKAGDANGFFFPEAVVCSFMWAADHGVNVTNNSYFADPWLFNCRNDAEQRAIWTAERRAIKYAQSKGVLVVAAEGNQADDLSHPTFDATSPDDTNPVLRAIPNACAVVPTEVPGVVGVTATGDRQMKSFYSSYGISAADVAAPGGDSVLQQTAAAPNGRVLSTWPASLAGSCLRKVFDGSALYCYAQGTSMASPHAAGVAALIASVTGKTGGALSAALQNAVDPIPCPADVSPYTFFPAVDNGAPQTCQGTLAQNSWFGAGLVDALKAVG
ncbi:S8 family serine peptidase [Terrabacter aerolatus]|uniref:Peptidase S8 n=1 Tax=Terrabacter aerolatus TaxID=422442 RepID=A0A512CXX1_9MICO|nr:S8 family serine peptidase [Terrabacter aerolatus]GEO29066.1 peptidase S8 [Terrabacter aerolatus]